MNFHSTRPAKEGLGKKDFSPYRRRKATCEMKRKIKEKPPTYAKATVGRPSKPWRRRPSGFLLKERRLSTDDPLPKKLGPAEAEAPDLVSACLAGISCRWDGRNCLRHEIRKLVAEGKAIAICPEEQGGLPTPRPPAEIVGGDGEDVLDGRAKVVNKFGKDLTKQFIKGARQVLRLAKKTKAKRAILKSRSTSCGLDQIYDGTFSHKLRKGNGVACAALRRAGIEVIADKIYLKGGSWQDEPRGRNAKAKFGSKDRMLRISGSKG